MTAQARPYSPETLADRWGCSAEKVRIMYRNGELPGFRLGKLIRIPAAEVERYECQNTPSPCTEESSPSPIETTQESRAEYRLARQIGGGPKLSPVNYGHE
jgi:excisionase family DNA binding protein